MYAVTYSLLEIVEQYDLAIRTLTQQHTGGRWHGIG